MRPQWSIWLILLLAVGQCAVLKAQENAKTVRFLWEASTVAEAFAYPAKEQIQNRGVAEWSLDWETKWCFGKHVRLVAAGRARDNAVDAARSGIFINEAYGAAQWGTWQIHAGKKQLNWGQSVGRSAFDLANRMDYYDYLDTDEEALGIWMAKVTGSIRESTLHIHLLPWFEPSQFYARNNRWLQVPSALPVNETPGVFLPARLDQTQEQVDYRFGFAIDWERPVGRWDLALRWFHGMNDRPLVSIQNPVPVADGAALEYDLLFRYEALDIAGITASTYAGSWNLWSECAWIRSEGLGPEGVLQDNPTLSWSVGTDRIFTGANPQQQARLLLQAMYEHPLGGDRYSHNDLDHALQGVFLADLDWRFHYRWHVGFRGAVEWLSGGYYTQSTLQWTPLEGITLALRGEGLWGNTDSFFGRYRSNSRLQIAAQFQFAGDTRRR